MHQRAAQLIRKFFTAYHARDRRTAESLLAEDFRFLSPYDTGLDKAGYFERCWPAGEEFRAVELESVADEGNDAFVRYRVTPKQGTPFRNTEFHRTDGERIRSVEVYFGSLPSSEPGESSPAAERLGVFAGKWRFEGRAVDSPFGKAAPVAGTERFEWLHGGRFLIHHLDGKLGGDTIACVEILGHDPASANFFARTFYNDGRAKLWTLAERQGVWTLTADWSDQQVRCTIRFEDSAKRRTSKWEYSSDGSQWNMFWDLTAQRIA